MRARWVSFVAGTLFGSAAVFVYFLLATSRRRDRAPAVVIDEVRPPGEAALAVRPPPEVRAHDFPLESESPDIDPLSQRW